MHLLRLVVNEKGQSVVNRLGINDVVVVKNEDEIVRDGGNFIEQGYQNRFGWRWLRRLECRQHADANLWRNCLQCCNEVNQKARGIAVPFIQRQPGNRSPTMGKPFANHCGLAKAGGSGDERQFATHCQPGVQPIDQAGARDNAGTGWGNIQFGG